MENVLRAERDGTVKKINVKPGDSLAVDAVIMEFASLSAAGAAEGCERQSIRDRGRPSAPVLHTGGMIRARR